LLTNTIERDTEKNRAIVWLERTGTLQPKNRGKLLIPAYVSNDEDTVELTRTFPANSGKLLVRYPEGFGYLPYVIGFVTLGGKRKCVRLHNWLWEQKYGAIPDGMVIHHLNGLRCDNRWENLQLLTNTEHGGLKRRAVGEPPPNDPDGLTVWDIHPKTDFKKATGEFENVRHTYVYVNSVFFGYYIPEKSDASNWHAVIGDMLFNQKASREQIHHRLNLFNSAHVAVLVDKEIEVVLKLLKWRPDFL
jgi:hypothetical protein